jgi:hypothetical protein
MKTRITLITMILLLGLAACAPAASPTLETQSDLAFGGSAARSAPQEQAPAPEMGVKDQTTSSSSLERIVIKNADLSIVVDDPGVSMEEIVRLAEGMGGYVVSSELYKISNSEGQEFPRARITVRVPAERLNEAMDQIKSGAGEVLSENVTGQDVTQEYTDLQSRLRNLQQAEIQLQKIMDSANKTEDVLAVYNQLTQVQEQIEVTKGQIQYYEQSAALSAIAIDIQAKAAVQPLTVAGWEPVGVARDATQALINSFKLLATAAIWVGIYLLPMAIILILPLLLVFLVIRIWRRRRQASEASPADA